MGNDDQISHVDIYHKLGALEAKMDAVVSRVSEYSQDLTTIFDRLRKLESQTAWAIGAIAAISVVMPFVIGVVGSNFNVKIVPQSHLPVPNKVH
jgi:hypothetical protein